MSEATAAEHPADPFQLLCKAVYRAIVADLYADLPPLHLADPALIAERVHAACAEFASMCPVNAEEARMAARVVTADAQARECIRHARGLSDDPIPATKCHAQANHLMRTANAARSLLLRVQSARRRREAVQASANRMPGPSTPPKASCSPPTATPPPNRPHRLPMTATASPAATRAAP